MKDLPLKAGMGFMIHGIVYQVVSVRKNGSAMIKPRFQATRALGNPTLTFKKPWWKKTAAYIDNQLKKLGPGGYGK